MNTEIKKLGKNILNIEPANPLDVAISVIKSRG